MAFRTSSALALLALFGAALLLQVALADEAGNGDLITASNNASIDFNTTPSGIDQDLEDEVEDVDEGHDQLFYMADERSEDHAEGSEDDANDAGEDMADEGGKELGEIQPYVYVPEADEVEVVADDVDQEQEETSAVARPLARILQQRSSKKCWSTKKCHKFYKSPGCCNRRCVNLSNDNRNCGKCKKCCDTRKGYLCQSGKCRKRVTPIAACSKTKKCKGGSSCCNGKCVNPEQDCKNCGKCGLKCAFGSACCQGQCKKLKTDCQNCGKCGRKCGRGMVCCNGQCVSLKQSQGHCGACGKHCGWGRKCCGGKCVSITSDGCNCGRCGHKCAKHVKCKYGICGYGH
jgi:hypothetical protein